MATTTVIITHGDENAATMSAELYQETGKRQEQAQALQNYIGGLLGGARNGKLEVIHDAVNPVTASATLTCASVVEDDTCIIAGVTFTAKDSPAGSVQFDVKGTDAAQATELAAVINAHATVSKWVVASASGAVVTISARLRGEQGNAITLTGTAVKLAASATRLGSGDGLDGTVRSYSFGK
jgi:hypothetical protein